MNESPSNSSPAGSLDGKTFAIGVLSVTACILLVGLVLVTMMPKTAHAIGQSDRGGDYVILTQQVANNYESVIVIDAATRKLNVYGLDATSPQRQIRLMQRGVPLDRLPGAAQPDKDNKK